MFQVEDEDASGLFARCGLEFVDSIQDALPELEVWYLFTSEIHSNPPTKEHIFVNADGLLPAGHVVQSESLHDHDQLRSVSLRAICAENFQWNVVVERAERLRHDVIQVEDAPVL